MEALQYIYTSWKNGDSTEKGYMIYSLSEGITESECSAIKDAMQYLAPKELPLTPTPQEIEDIFPYAFSYFILPTGRGCVAQSTYLGKDYSGRYGNYIIYALVFDINDLPCLPAELFAESYIKTAMTQDELDAPSPVPPLPPLHITEYASVINDEQLNEFLFDKEDEFAQLISMILAAQDAGVPFYLNDIRENLVLWAAAVQRILPSRMAKKFMFNTYIGDHESMRSAKAREQGLNFHLIGVRPDANYFNYETECRSNRHIVIDFIDGHMTSDVSPIGYAQAMAASIAFDCEEVDSFGEFVDSTSFCEINGHLQDAYLYYHLLRNDEFEFNEHNLKAVILFGAKYCSDDDNSDIGSKLLLKYQQEKWTLEHDTLALIWQFVANYSSFMMFTLYELFTETVYQYANEASGSCSKLNSLIKTVRDEVPEQYKEYLEYLNNANNVEHLLLYLSGHANPSTNNFYILWLLNSYKFTGGIYNGQPISKLLEVLLKNITIIKAQEKQMVELLINASDNRELFENILNIFMDALSDPKQLDLLSTKYIELSETLTDKETNRFEQLLLEAPDAVPLATKLCSYKIASSKNPEEVFWSFYNSQRTRSNPNTGFILEPLILACINNVEAKNRENVAIDILRRIDTALINDGETIKVLTNIVNDCSIKTLSKMDVPFLQKLCTLRAQVESNGLEKVKAVYFGERLAINNSQRIQPINLSDELAQIRFCLSNLDKADYEAYIKNYFSEYHMLLLAIEDIPAIIKVFYHGQFFPNFVDDYISSLKKMEKKETDRWKRILGWTCVYLITAERSDPAVDILYKPTIRYLRSLDENELLDVRYNVVQNVPSERCNYLFDEVRRKEGLSEKLGNLFHKK